MEGTERKYETKSKLHDEVIKINEYLIRDYGRDVATGLPRFRIVWSDNEMEVRKGPFNIYSGNLFLRTEPGPKKMHKYTYIHQKYVLEMLTDTPVTDVVNSLSNRYYEILHQFRECVCPAHYKSCECTGKFQMPVYGPIKFLIHLVIHPNKHRKSVLEAMEDKVKKKEVEDNFMFLQNNVPWLAGQMKEGHAVFLDRTKQTYAGE